jgi:hypothetical protein
MSHKRDILDRLADARPARLDAPADHRGHVEAIVARAGHDLPARRSHKRRMVLGSVGVTATAAVTAAVLLVGGPAADPRNTDRRAGASTATQAPFDAHQLLLAAAERSSQRGLADGRYLVIRTENVMAWRVEDAGGSYTMMARQENQIWLARSASDKSWAITQTLGAVPASPQDEAAWRSRGAPAVVKVKMKKLEELSTAPGEPRGNTFSGSNFTAIGDHNMTVADLDALPRDPAALRAKLLQDFDGGGGDLPTDRDQWLFEVGTRLVIDMPVSAAVRAAAYRMIAAIPGVRGLGAVHDTRGRPGQATARLQDGPAGRIEVRLIVDLDSGQALGREYRAIDPRGDLAGVAPGALTGYVVVLEMAARDDNPPPVRVEDTK